MASKAVLIVDDDDDLVHKLTFWLQRPGVEVFHSRDATQALRQARRVHPDLVVLDGSMPGADGLFVVEMLAGDETLAPVPVIVMAERSDDRVRQRCQSPGEYYVAKGPQMWDSMKPLCHELLNLPSDPCAHDAQEPDKEPKTQDASNHDRCPKVLCIDDDAEISKLLRLRLEPYGVDVIRAFNGMQGYWTALDMQPGVIITDLSMPEGEGNYIVGRLRSHPLTENTPILVLSGNSNPGVKRQMLSLGVDAYLVKPLAFEDLLERLNRYIPLSDPITKSPGV